MNVLLAAGLYPPDIGGPATYAALIEAALPARGVAVTVVPFRSVRSYPVIIRHVLYTWKLYRNSKGVDCIYALDPVSVGVPAALVAKLRGVPLLVRLGGDYAWEQATQRFGVHETLDEFVLKTHTYPWPVRLLVALQSWVATQARKVVVPSKYLGRIIEAWGVPSEKIVVIYSAHKPLHLEKTKDQYRADFGYTRPTLISVGRLVPWKGFAELLDAVAFLKKDIPDLQLLIGGDGEQRAFLETKVKQGDLTNHVRFLGGLPRKEMSAHIKASDIFVLNTAYEGLSHQLLEVMELGTPIVTTTAGGNTELITTSGKEGLLVPTHNTPALVEAIRTMLSDRELQASCTKEAALRLKEFSDEAMLSQLTTLIKTIHG